MNRNEEYRALLQSLDHTPAELDSAVTRARARAKRSKAGRRFGIPVASLAGVAAAFVLLVNISTPFALACKGVPLLETLAKAVAFSPSLTAALEHDYVQNVAQTQQANGATMTVEYLIVDQKQVNIFYTTGGDAAPRYMVHPNILALDGSSLESHSLHTSMALEHGEMQLIRIDFMDQVPEGFLLRCPLIPVGDSLSAASPDPTAAAGAPSGGEPPEPAPVATLTFELHFDPSYTGTGELLSLGQWITLDSQRLCIDSVEIYPSHLRINFLEDGENTAWLSGLDFYMEDEKGRRYEPISNGIKATGSDGTHSMLSQRLESSYFDAPEHLTLTISSVTWLHKDQEYITVDLKEAAAPSLPQGVTLLSAQRQGREVHLAFQAACYEENHHYQLFGTTYLDPQGGEHQYSTTTSSTVANNEMVFVSQFSLADYPWDTVELMPLFSSHVILDVPMEITVK